MKTLMKTLLAALEVLGLVILFKLGQKLCWEFELPVISPPSLDSWDPTERVEAARQAAKRYGGKQ